MKFLRWLGKFLGSTLFSTFLVLAILAMELVTFTSYDSFTSLASQIFEKQLFSATSEQDLTVLHNLLISQCLQKDEIILPITSGQMVLLKCADVRNSEKSQLTNLITTALVDNLYYKKFDCSFIGCIKEGDPQNLLIVVSNEGNLFYRSLQIYTWLATGLGLALFLISSETWVGRLKGVGFNLVFTSLPFLILVYANSFFLPTLPQELESSVKPVIDGLLASIKNKFTVILVAGIILLVIGYGLGFYLLRKRKKK